MYRAYVRRRIWAIFDALSRGEYTLAVNGLADDVRLVLVGDMPTMLEFAREPSRFVPLVNQGRLRAAPR